MTTDTAELAPDGRVTHPCCDHCGAPVVYGYDGDPEHHRGMCEPCDLVRCDAYPGECGAQRPPKGAVFTPADCECTGGPHGGYTCPACRG